MFRNCMGRQKKQLCIFLTIVLVILVTSSSLTAQPFRAKQQAKKILNACDVNGGLIVHIGCGDGKLTAALRANERFIVQGLDSSGEKVEKAQKYIHSLGIYGAVSVDKLQGNRLPYVDNLVNLVVSENPGTVPESEVMRILCPDGVAYIRQGNKWKKLIKQRPEDIDEWTHYLHDASNNAVAQDTQVGPPRRLKWVCGPLWSRSHEFTSSLCAMVSSKGRVFYVFDEGLTGVTTPSVPEKWMLIARDAFNGLLLWKRPLMQWGTGSWKNKALRSVPMTIPRCLVTEGQRVFITLGYKTGVSVLDAATGEILTTYKGTEGTEEIRCIQGILVLRKSAGAVMAIDTRTGRKLWEATGNIRPFSLAARDGKVFYQVSQWLMCLRLTDGKELWRSPSKLPISLLVAHDTCIILLNKAELEGISVDTGKSIWAIKAGIRRNELFIADNQLWHWQGNRIVGRDLLTGNVATRLNTDDVFTAGHHLRCYQSKATDNFLITPNRGVEFVSITGGVNTQSDWLRGPCRFGIMPSNGLLYSPPNPCFCYPGVKLTGFNAMSAKGEAVRELSPSQRLKRGSAYKYAKELAGSGGGSSDDWPTYRHDARRTGAADCDIPAQLSEQWQVRLRGRLTPPVVSDNRVYAAARDEHTLYVCDFEDGRELWRFTAGGRIDSPPSVYGELVLFGCADGRVYCLRASDGELVWRFTAAPSEKSIVAFGQLESPWRVHGSVLMKDGIAYFTAGRSTYIDGGIRVFGLEPATGKVLYETCLDTWARTREDAENKPFIPGYHMEGANSDILVSEGDFIYLGQYKFDRSLKVQETPYVLADPDKKTNAMGLDELMNKSFVQSMEIMEKDEKVQRDWQLRVWPQMAQQHKNKYGGSNLGDRKMGRHVLSTSGFLDESWFNRTFWMYSDTWPGFYIAHRASKTGQLLVVGPDKTYAVQAYPSRNLQSPLFTPAARGYLLLADDNDNEPILPDYTRGVPKGIGFTRGQPPVWHDWVPVRIRAMVLAGKTLFVTGPPDVIDPDDPMAAFEGGKGGLLWAVSAADGKKLGEYKLESPPIFDGMIAANGQLYISTQDGRLLCMGKEN
ncbi:MAG: PQQ-binding-like beta-propeller repeat protein [Planctomycetes bacterium]|nr:PQQ-binding-like beta-propeller repeat protein [Planctomycetota bacterium]